MHTSFDNDIINTGVPLCRGLIGDKKNIYIYDKIQFAFLVKNGCRNVDALKKKKLKNRKIIATSRTHIFETDPLIVCWT